MGPTLACTSQLGVTFGGQQAADEPYWRAWKHDAAAPGKVLASASRQRGPLLESDLATFFEYVALINPAASVLAVVMEGMLELDGTSARRFG